MEEDKATSSTVNAEESKETKQEKNDEKSRTVDEILSAGKRHLACGENQEAADCFEDACGQLSTKHGQTGKELAEPYFLYGKALLEVGRQESGVLGTGVPTEADDDDDSGEESCDEEVAKEPEVESKGESSNQPDGGTTETVSEVKPEDEAEMETEDQGEKSATTEQTKQEQGQDSAGTSGNNEPSAESNTKNGEEANLDDTSDVPTIQLAWEVLELSRIIYEKDGADTHALRLAEIHLLLGEINMESDHQEEAADDFRKALKIRTNVLAEHDRRIAECHFQLGMLYTLSKSFDQSVEAYEFAKSVLKKKLESLRAAQPSSDTDTSAAADEIKEIEGILPDIDLKIEDVLEMKKMALDTKMRGGDEGETTSGFDSPKLDTTVEPTKISVRKAASKNAPSGNKRTSIDGNDKDLPEESTAKRLKPSNGEDAEQENKTSCEASSEQ